MYKKLTQYEKGFLEGLIDAEGCLCLYMSKTGYACIEPEFTISNTNVKLLKKARKFVGGGTIQYCKNRNIKYKKLYLLKMSPNIMREVLPQLNLIEKEHKRKIMLKILPILIDRHQWGRWNKNYRVNELLKFYNEFYKGRKNHE